MTGANTQTNGASLEDCHANFFSLVSTFIFSSNGFQIMKPRTPEKVPEMYDYEAPVIKKG
jgi:hypothetical protein